ncbi:gamma-glutamylcyclotransferase family protein [Mangrovibacillus cuniculi]|uniref:Gamma-glutamylcyclotransferase n=1 Tax=Mangrovibacillus cuniculi TaxID=2593652 RepID=A0A7S8CAT1_9BACI|nr:gamma-glutamylcyclotransferase [Mangrovibacillus cuniculi]QPC46560.1 gamma-glutamylcyclotransferase [Mangrovibacillus cuniculi]
MRFVFGKDQSYFTDTKSNVFCEQANILGEGYYHNGQYKIVLNGVEKVYGELHIAEERPEHSVEVNVKTDNGDYLAWIAQEDILEVATGIKVSLGNAAVDDYLKENHEYYYFAYGSCMDHERFKLANVVHHFQNGEKASLSEYDMRYTFMVHDGSRADIVESKGSEVEGVCYNVPKEAIDYLYVREGVNGGWYRPAIIQVKVNERLLWALTFLVISKVEESLPPNHYSSEIVRGAINYQLSDSYIRRLEKKLQDLQNIKD